MNIIFKLCLVAALVGCANPNQHLGVINATSLAASTAGLICDGLQTYSAASQGWKTAGMGGPSEANPILGSRPSTTAVTMYMGTAVLTNIVMWAVMPKKLKSVIAIPVFAAEAESVTINAVVSHNICGI
jgi:hypothetical protein